MIGRVFLDTFSSFDDLPKKYWGDETKVLETITAVGRVSAFEMTQTLSNTLKRLEAKGKISNIKSDYPWINYKVNVPGGD